MGIKYENPSVEALKQMNPSHDSACKILNVYVVYDLDAWPKNPTSNFKFKNCLFGATSVEKIVIKESMCMVDTK